MVKARRRPRDQDLAVHVDGAVDGLDELDLDRAELREALVDHPPRRHTVDDDVGKAQPLGKIELSRAEMTLEPVRRLAQVVGDVGELEKIGAEQT